VPVVQLKRNAHAAIWAYIQIQNISILKRYIPATNRSSSWCSLCPAEAPALSPWYKWPRRPYWCRWAPRRSPGLSASCSPASTTRPRRWWLWWWRRLACHPVSGHPGRYSVGIRHAGGSTGSTACRSRGRKSWCPLWPARVWGAAAGSRRSRRWCRRRLRRWTRLRCRWLTLSLSCICKH